MHETSAYPLARIAQPQSDPVDLRDIAALDDQLHPLKEYWLIVIRHCWLILICALTTFVCAALYAYTRTPLYTADTTLMIERKPPQFLRMQDARPENNNDYDYNNDFQKTQQEILKSRALAERVVQREGLQAHPLFNRAAGASAKPGPITEILDSAKKSVSALLPEQSHPEPQASTPNNAGLVNAYLSLLEVKPVAGTSLVQLKMTTPNPVWSAQLANAHAQAYVRYGIDMRSEANDQATDFLEQKLIELKERVEQSEAALNKYRRDKGIISVDDKDNIVVSRLLDLNKDLTAAEAERIRLQAQVHTMQSRRFDAVPSVLQSGVVSALKGELGKFEAEYAALAKEFRPGYPPLDNLKARIDQTRRRLQSEVKNEQKGVEAAYAAAKLHEDDLRARMEEQKKSTLALKDDAVQYVILAREVDTNRQLYDGVLQRLKEIGVAGDVRNSNVYILGKAHVPLGPSYPNRHRVLLLGLLMGLAGGVGLALLLDQLDSTLKSPEEAERYVRLPNLALVPDFACLTGGSYGYVTRLINSAKAELPAPRSRRSEGQLVLDHHPLSLVTEAYRSLRSSLLLSQPGKPPQAMLVTSAARAEGKTTTLVNTAIVYSQMGAKVLIVDADLRRPHCHSLLKMEKGVGLVEVLAGQIAWRDAVQSTAAENLFFLSAGELPPNPAELLISTKMREVLEDLRAEYDYIFIDSSPIMAVSDAVFLSTMVDGTLLVIDGKTPKQLVKKARARLNIPNPKILGTMLNRVDIRTVGYSKYYRQYYEYYR